MRTSEAQVSRGFDRTVEANALFAEVVRQPSLWVMEVQLKPIRMVWLDTKDPVTGEVKPTEVWYMVWRAINRPLPPGRTDDSQAVNTLDPLPGPMQFIPQFTLVTYDSKDSEVPSQIIVDSVLPMAVKKIEQLERRTSSTLLNTVSAVQDVPSIVEPDSDDQPWIYGVATWTGVDPTTDFFKVILQGFSNGYENRSDDPENPELWRKVIIQEFYRPGDEFDPSIVEFQYVGQPMWTYQPDSKQPAANAQ
ncbi:hypothetical protein AB1L42_12860 [Thalassoglobus sp. JC818]|uniref:hypothetical protein n=1 Tax=Thalassoglobus sp. JC818 TaxID=3232136 RepID=UPI00345ABB75